MAKLGGTYLESRLGKGEYIGVFFIPFRGDKNIMAHFLKKRKY